MNLKELINYAVNKDQFTQITDYFDFALYYLEFIKSNLQAVIVSKNENHYNFFQYKKEGSFNVTRPINSNLMYNLENFEISFKSLIDIINDIKNYDNPLNREILNRTIYTSQQCIGATLDALPANKANTARKINGDLFERFIRLIIKKAGIEISSGVSSITVNLDENITIPMKYQHDLILQANSKVKAIGSVKTSSKDRIDKIFIDKFIYNKLTESNTPHFAIFLNDVQRKGKDGKYGINGTFLSGHFKIYTIKLNPLDGVYYCDIRPNMSDEYLLKDHIKTFDNFLFTDVWKIVQ